MHPRNMRGDGGKRLPHPAVIFKSVFYDLHAMLALKESTNGVLEKHRKHLDPDIAIDEPVKVVGKARGIVDLMLSRAARRHRANDIEHLVVELKAPKVGIGADEITQIKRYALAVSEDERFHTVAGVNRPNGSQEPYDSP
jgi:hypothetical protein